MKEVTFNFDLQTFADGDGYVDMEQPTEDSDTGVTEEVDTPDFGIDEDGNPVFFNQGAFGDDEEVEEDENPDTVPAEPNGQSTEPETYVVKVNGQEQEVTLDELLHGYMRNQDYTRKTQALAEERRNLQYAQPQQVQPYNNNPQAQPQVQQPQQPQITQRDYYTQLDTFARQEVQKVLGEEFDEYNPLHQAAYTDSIANIKAEIYAVRQQEAEKQRVVDNFNHTMGKYFQDPNFQAINQLALEKLNNLPYAQAVQIKQAMENYDSQTIDAYMTVVRNEYYGANQVPTIQRKQPTAVKQSIKPPYVESAGAATVPPGNPTTEIDYSKLRGLSVDQQAEVLSKLNYFAK